MFDPNPDDAVLPEQLHDVQPGVRPHPDDPTMGGLFWTAQLPDDSFWVSSDGRSAHLRVHKLCMSDSFQFFSNFDTPALLSCDIKFGAIGKAVSRGLGAGSDAECNTGTEWEGNVADAHASGRVKIWSMGYEADSWVTSTPKSFEAPLGGWAQLGTERNGCFLPGAKKAAPPMDPPKHSDPKRAGARGNKE